MLCPVFFGPRIRCTKLSLALTGPFGTIMPPDTGPANVISGGVTRACILCDVHQYLPSPSSSRLFSTRVESIMATHQDSKTLSSSHSHYGPLSFPSTMSVHGQWTKWKSMNLCGAHAKDRLCLIEMQTGYSGKPPLGMRTGFLLRDGMSPKDPLLAAAGDEVPGLHAFNPDGIIFLRGSQSPVDDLKCMDMGMKTELMSAEPGVDNDVAFRFAIEVGEELRREEFAWRRVKEGKRNGYKLIQVSSQSDGGCDNAEPVAFLEWRTVWSSLTHAFTLQLADGQAGALGERWTLMVVATAIRLYTLYIKGRTNRAVVGIGKGTFGR